VPLISRIDTINIPESMNIPSSNQLERGCPVADPALLTEMNSLSPSHRESGDSSWIDYENTDLAAIRLNNMNATEIKYVKWDDVPTGCMPQFSAGGVPTLEMGNTGFHAVPPKCEVVKCLPFEIGRVWYNPGVVEGGYQGLLGDPGASRTTRNWVYDSSIPKELGFGLLGIFTKATLRCADEEHYLLASHNGTYGNVQYLNDTLTHELWCMEGTGEYKGEAMWLFDNTTAATRHTSDYVYCRRRVAHAVTSIPDYNTVRMTLRWELAVDDRSVKNQ
jgi:hypothetical protein